MGLMVSKKQLAEIFDVSERTLTEWQQKGMPIAHDADRGMQNQYDTAACINWRINQLVHGSSESPKDRKDRVSADMIELQIAERCKQLVPADEVEAAWSGMVIGCRAELMNMAEKLKVTVDAMYGIELDIGLVNDYVHDALGKLAAGDTAELEQHPAISTVALCAAIADVDDGVG